MMAQGDSDVTYYGPWHQYDEHCPGISPNFNIENPAKSSHFPKNKTDSTPQNNIPVNKE